MAASLREIKQIMNSVSLEATNSAGRLTIDEQLASAIFFGGKTIWQW
jgi:hypothetical protein